MSMAARILEAWEAGGGEFVVEDEGIDIGIIQDENEEWWIVIDEGTKAAIALNVGNRARAVQAADKLHVNIAREKRQETAPFPRRSLSRVQATSQDLVARRARGEF